MPQAQDGNRRRAEYSSDASNYRVIPAAVAFPRDLDEVLAAIDTARSAGVAVTVRGAGTSVAGNAIGPGLVLDLSRHLGGVTELDPSTRTVRVGPGTILDDLNRAAGAHGLRFGPDPSTHARATLGGMIGNNACGAHAIAYGRTSENVLELDVVDGAGRRFLAGTGPDQVPGLDRVVEAHLGVLRTELGRFPRQASGYSMEHLLPERGQDLAKALVGTEGTVAVVLGARLRLVPAPVATALAVLGYPDMATAADAVPAVVAAGRGASDRGLLALEGLDARLVDVVRRHRGTDSVAGLPAGGAWLFVETGADTRAEAEAEARRVAAGSSAVQWRVVPAGPAAAALWRIREDGAGLAGRTAQGRAAWPGWEDAAVPPDRLGEYLRDFTALLGEHRLDGLMYGHLGDGCLHVRLDLPLGRHPERLRPFLVDAARLVASYGGSLSGEHGDGRARSELLGLMYSPAVLDAFAAFKGVLDPDDLLNPGVLVRPRPVDADLRLPAARLLAPHGGFALATDGGDLTAAVHRCVGVGKCRADTTAAGGFMCPSYLATADEKDSTRGRSRVLQEMANGTLITGGWSAPEVHEALDLCLSCKACASDCPAGVDMARYKAQVLYETYRRRLRPVTHYALGWLPRWVRLAARAPRLVNGLLGLPGVTPLARRLAGIDGRRLLPRLAVDPIRPRASAPMSSALGAGPAAHHRPAVLLWMDTFTAGFSPEVARAAVRVLESAGYQVLSPEGSPCCGLTWISTGQLDAARRRLRRTLDALFPAAEAGIPIVGLEPSCTAVLRSDLVELLGEDPRAPVVAAATQTLAELLSARLAEPGTTWRLPRLDGVRVLVQPHCHHYAVMGWQADRALLESAGATVAALAGCCGLAGDFGMTRGHYEVSVAVAEHALLPALRAVEPGTVVLADGFSCRTQIDQLGHRHARHLAELLAQPPP
ncbi:MAG: FAD-binding and (Fe-S)-binding domain-containing protein [Actinomycetes bacterium]